MGYGIANLDKLYVTINIDNETIDSKYFPTILDIYAGLRTPNTLFEVNEKTFSTHGDKLNSLASLYDVRFALDDKNEMNIGLQLQLEEKTAMTKIDFNFWKELWRSIGNKPNRVIEEIEKHLIGDKPIVFEGIESKEEIDFLRKYWKIRRNRLLAQGYFIKPDKPWSKWITDLTEIECGHGFVVDEQKLDSSGAVISSHRY